MKTRLGAGGFCILRTCVCICTRVQRFLVLLYRIFLVHSIDLEPASAHKRVFQRMMKWDGPRQGRYGGRVGQQERKGRWK